MTDNINIFWFRRDLRLEDNAGFFAALKKELPVLPIFIFDKNILDELDEPNDRRVSFIHYALQQMQEKLVSVGSSLQVFYGIPEEIFQLLVKQYSIGAVFANHDYEPYALQRDEEIKKQLAAHKAAFYTFKDQVIFERNEIEKDDGTAYSVYTPYAKRWRAGFDKTMLQTFASEKLLRNCLRHESKEIPSLQKMGFQPAPHPPIENADEAVLHNYHSTRNIPSLSGTSRMGVHLRFGTISIRSLVAKALQLNDVFLGELIWREFFMQMLWRHPRLVTRCFKPSYEAIQWRNNETEFARWCEGKTGYPLVDAGMRELNETGFMHNRVRMVTASFLVKHLLIDWRWGEAYFAKKLLDFELSSNNGNWQWVAGCGADAAPYFRIFNPQIQLKKFDPQLLYVKKWVAEFDTLDYPQQMVVHELARERCLKVYKEALQKSNE